MGERAWLSRVERAVTPSTPSNRRPPEDGGTAAAAGWLTVFNTGPPAVFGSESSDAIGSPCLPRRAWTSATSWAVTTGLLCSANDACICAPPDAIRHDVHRHIYLRRRAKTHIRIGTYLCSGRCAHSKCTLEAHHGSEVRVRSPLAASWIALRGVHPCACPIQALPSGAECLFRRPYRA